MDKAKILLVDDNETFHKVFLSLDEAQGFDVIPVSSADEALNVVEKQSVDIIISDVQMPCMTGTELFREVQDRYEDIPVILVTAFGSTQEAIQAVKEGAFHYFEKPMDDKLDIFWATVREALAKREMQNELASLRRERSLQLRTPAAIIGQSKGIQEVVRSIQEVAPLPVTVLIHGETGTGKELVARAIQRGSDRRDKPFFAVNCNEFAPGVLESELFGHEKGAFTGAVHRKLGLFDAAHKGILFLDEIGGAPLFFQSKLLRVLETKTFMRARPCSSGQRSHAANRPQGQGTRAHRAMRWRSTAVLMALTLLVYREPRLVMAGLVPAIHVFPSDVQQARRGCPEQRRAKRRRSSSGHVRA